MRLSKSLHGQRVNADLQFRFEAPGLTSFAGLELVRMYFARSGVLSRIKTLLGRSLPASDFGVGAWCFWSWRSSSPAAGGFVT